jgi:hypothetical protein
MDHRECLPLANLAPLWWKAYTSLRFTMRERTNDSEGMAMVEEQIAVTLRLPKSLVEQIGASAGRDNKSMEDEIRAMIGLALAIDADPEVLAAKAEEDHSAHLAAAGQRRPTTTELWEQMRRVREEVADELYPD